MSEQKLSLADAIAKIEELKRLNPYYAPVVKVLEIVLRILARVDPDEEGKAVLWLMRENDYDVCYERDHYAVYHRVEDTDNDWCWVSDAPIEEAKKLGWGG